MINIQNTRGSLKLGNTDSKEKLIELMNKYQNLVFSICLKMTGDYFCAEDITQETFISAYEHLENLDETLEKAWICRIASNKCIDYLKAAERRAAPTAEEEMPETVSRDGPFEEFFAKDIVENIREKCDDLPKTYAFAAEMYFVDGMTAKEISEKTDTPLKSVQTRIRRAREMLQKKVRKEDFLS